MESKRKVNASGAHGLVQVFRDYVDKMLSVSGMKVLALDTETTKMLGMVYSLSNVVSKQVFLVENISATAAVATQNAGKMNHLKCVVFVRPTKESLQYLEAALRSPKYKEYHIFFSNMLEQDKLRLIAQADEYNLVRQVQEYYADFYAVDRDVWSLNLFHTRALHQTSTYWTGAEREVFNRNVEGVLSMLLAHKKKPQVRYGVHSTLGKTLATEIARKFKQEKQLFYFKQNNDPLLLILDRREDPVTPLLTQWTYRAMVHELLGITNNVVDMRAVPDVAPELREVVLAPHQDTFFADASMDNFGDLGVRVKQYVTSFQSATNSKKELKSIQDMQKFMDTLPEYKQKSGNVNKHVALVSELSRLVDAESLLVVSELEQDIACTDDHATHVKALFEILENLKVKFKHKLIVVLLYALRYEKVRNELQQFTRVLRDRATTDDEKTKLTLVTEIIKYAGADQRGGDLFSNKSLFDKIANTAKLGLVGVENIYTQHKPLLAQILTAVQGGKLKSTDFPFVEGGGNSKTKYELVFVYMIGGITYEEAATIREHNAANPNMQVILGGSCIHSSKSFCEDVLQLNPANNSTQEPTELKLNVRR